MLTHNEVCQMLEENYTPEEIIEMLGITSRDLVQEFPEYIQQKHDVLVEQIREDTGYGITSDEG